MKAMKDYRELLKEESLSFEARDFKAGNQKQVLFLSKQEQHADNLLKSDVISQMTDTIF